MADEDRQGSQNSRGGSQQLPFGKGRQKTIVMGVLRILMEQVMKLLGTGKANDANP